MSTEKIQQGADMTVTVDVGEEEVDIVVFMQRQRQGRHLWW
jgi:hypothetical protein